LVGFECRRPTRYGSACFVYRLTYNEIPMRVALSLLFALGTILTAGGCSGNSQKGINKDLDRPGTPTTKAG